MSLSEKFLVTMQHTFNLGKSERGRKKSAFVLCFRAVSVVRFDGSGVVAAVFFFTNSRMGAVFFGVCLN